MACIICRIAGTSFNDFFDAKRSDVVKSFTFSSVKGYPCPDTLQELQAKAALQNRCKTIGNSTVIDGAIQVTIPEQHALVEVWNKVLRTSTRVQWVSIPLGLGALTVGGWKAISDRSVLKGVGTLYVAVAAAVFAMYANFLALVARERKEWLQNAPTHIAAHRKHVIENWVDAESEQFKTRERVFELFTKEELALLLNSHSDNEHKKLYATHKNSYRRWFERFFDKSSVFYTLFMKRFDAVNITQRVIDFPREVSAADFVLLSNCKIMQLLSFKRNAALEEEFKKYKDEYLTCAYKETFAKVLNSQGVDDYDAYIAWVREQFNKLPKTYGNKPFLISCLPEKTL